MFGFIQRSQNMRLPPRPVLALEPSALIAKNEDTVPYRIPVPTFNNLRKQFPKVEPVAPMVEEPEVPAAVESVQVPAQPEISPEQVVDYVLNSRGIRHIRLIFEDGAFHDYKFRGFRDTCGKQMVSVNLVGFAGVRHYLGTIFSGGHFRSTGATLPNNRPHADYFGRWWNAIHDGAHTPGIVPWTGPQLKLADDITEAAKKSSRPPPSADAGIAIRAAMDILHAFDPDAATNKNSVGFSKADTRFGNRLSTKSELSEAEMIVAREMVHRYRRQIPADILERAMAD